MKIDLHVHSAEISQCGRIPAVQLVKLYRDAGYDAIVLTNHFNPYTAEYFSAHGHPDFAKVYMAGFALAEREGAKLGLRVFCGLELHFLENSNDYLVYGMPDDLLQDPRRLFAMKAVDFCALARERGFLCYQAHPFRNSMTIVPPEALFGIEVRNGHPRHDSRNEIAEAWARKYHLHAIGGSDAHRPEDVGTSGIETSRDVCSMADLVAVLREDDYTILGGKEEAQCR